MADTDLNITVIGDPVRLGQILTNLISNAVKFTHEGKVTIYATVAKNDQDQISIDFKVEDTGIGIPADKIDCIFESFTQASSETTRKYGGTGLGLAITKRLLELQNSNIYVKSQAGQGSVFYFQLSFKTSQHKVNHQIPEALPTVRSLKGMKILIAEDNMMNVVLMKNFMKGWDVETDIAENGLLAVELVQINDYDLVLMDLQMPEMDGYQATAKIRALPEKKYLDLPIIALTASAMLDIRDIAYTSGMNDFVSKPFNPNELYAKLAVYRKTK